MYERSECVRRQLALLGGLCQGEIVSSRRKLPKLLARREPRSVEYLDYDELAFCIEIKIDPLCDFLCARATGIVDKADRKRINAFVVFDFHIVSRRSFVLPDSWSALVSWRDARLPPLLAATSGGDLPALPPGKDTADVGTSDLALL